jgi:antitoxin component of MazEF toxin-antitoxin module
MIEVELKEWGNSTGVILPSEKLKELGVKKGDRILLDIQKKRIDGFGMCRGAKPFRREREHDDL